MEESTNDMFDSSFSEASDDLITNDDGDLLFATNDCMDSTCIQNANTYAMKKETNFLGSSHLQHQIHTLDSIEIHTREISVENHDNISRENIQTSTSPKTRQYNGTMNTPVLSGNVDNSTHTPASNKIASEYASSSKSDFSALMSPFSNKARQQRLKINEPDIDINQSFSPPSLTACRKVSVIVRVKPLLENKNASFCVSPTSKNIRVENLGSNQEISHCVFPLVDQESKNNENNCYENETGQLVIVNPKAFGNFVSMDVTVAAARAAAVLKDIPSEDWTRRYHFDDVLWPSGANNTKALTALSEAVVEDALLRKVNSTIFGFGDRSTGKTHTLFGNDFVDVNKHDGNFQEKGILEMLIEKLLNSSKHIDITLSFLEILDENSLKDLLNETYYGNQKKPIVAEHIDKKGAIVQNLTEVKIDSIDAFRSYYETAARARSEEAKNCNLHVMSYVHVHHFPNEFNTDDSPLRSKQGKITTIQLVDLATSDTDMTSTHDGLDRERRSASVRKSIAALGALLRSLIISHSASISFRESTLTRLLKRCLDSPRSRAVMIATVCPSKRAYMRTLNTLNYVNRLLRKPGHTAKSPFERKLNSTDGSDESTISKEVTRKILSSAADAFASKFPSQTIADINSAQQNVNVNAKTRGALLQNAVTDPRQRLGLIMKGIMKAQKEVATATPLIKESEVSTSASEFNNDDQAPIAIDFDFSLLDKIEDIGKTQDDPELSKISELLKRIQMSEDNVISMQNQHEKDKKMIDSLQQELQQAVRAIQDEKLNGEKDKDELLKYLSHAEEVIEKHVEAKETLKKSLDESEKTQKEVMDAYEKDMVLNGKEIEELSHKLNDKLFKYDKLRDENEASKVRADGLQAKLLEMEVAFEKATKIFNEENTTLHVELKQQKNQENILVQQIKDLKNVQKKLEMKNREMQGCIREAEENLTLSESKCESTVNDYTKKVSTLKNDVEERMKKEIALVDETNALESDRECLVKENERLQVAVQIVEEKLAHSKAEFERVTEDFAKKSSILEYDLKQHISNERVLSDKIESLKNDKDCIANKNNVLHESLSKMKTDLASSQEDYDTKAQKLEREEDLLEMLENYSKRIQLLESQVDSLIGDKQAVMDEATNSSKKAQSDLIIVLGECEELSFSLENLKRELVSLRVAHKLEISELQLQLSKNRNNEDVLWEENTNLLTERNSLQSELENGIFYLRNAKGHVEKLLKQIHDLVGENKALEYELVGSGKENELSCVRLKQLESDLLESQSLFDKISSIGRECKNRSDEETNELNSKGMFGDQGSSLYNATIRFCIGPSEEIDRKKACGETHADSN